MDEQASSSSVDCSSNGDSDEIQWRFSQIKGNIETDESPTDGNFLISLKIILEFV